MVGPEETDPKWFQTKENDTRCTIVKYLDSGDGEVVIPPQIGGLPVTEIGKGAFYSCRSLTSVVIPQSVEDIGKDVFKDCPHLKIQTPAGSFAEQYAKKAGIPVTLIQ